MDDRLTIFIFWDFTDLLMISPIIIFYDFTDFFE